MVNHRRSIQPRALTVLIASLFTFDDGASQVISIEGVDAATQEEAGSFEGAPRPPYPNALVWRQETRYPAPLARKTLRPKTGANVSAIQYRGNRG